MDEGAEIAELDQQISAARTDGEVIARYYHALVRAGMPADLIYTLTVSYGCPNEPAADA